MAVTPRFPYDARPGGPIEKSPVPVASRPPSMVAPPCVRSSCTPSPVPRAPRRSASHWPAVMQLCHDAASGGVAGWNARHDRGAKTVTDRPTDRATAPSSRTVAPSHRLKTMKNDGMKRRDKTTRSFSPAPFRALEGQDRGPLCARQSRRSAVTVRPGSHKKLGPNHPSFQHPCWETGT